jgi:uncharacterized damage-inducible protein DinB
MAVGLTMNDLLDYSDCERRKWFEWMRDRGEDVLSVSTGLHGDGRFATVGELMRHIFSAEKRYVERLSQRPITDTSTIPADNIEALYQLAGQSRRELRELIESLPAADWDEPREFRLMNNIVTATPRKVVTHILFHEIRHWAQIATLWRLNGLNEDFHDFLFSPVMGGELRRETQSA